MAFDLATLVVKLMADDSQLASALAAAYSRLDALDDRVAAGTRSPLNIPGIDELQGRVQYLIDNIPAHDFHFLNVARPHEFRLRHPIANQTNDVRARFD